MKWTRFVIVALFLAVLGCTSATAPRYPQPEEDKGGETDPDKHGLVMPVEVGVWI